MEKFKFLHLTIDTRYGGVYKFIESWAKEDSYKNKNICHFTFKYQSFLKTEISNFKYNPSNIREKSGYFFIIDLILNFSVYLKYSFKADFIILHSTYLFPIAILLRFLNKKFIFISHDFNNPFVLRLIINIFFNKNLVCVAPWLKEYFLLNFHAKFFKKILNLDNNIKVIIPTTSENFLKSNKYDYKFNKIQDNILSLIYIGSLSPVKGISDLTKLLELTNLKINLHIIGRKNKRYIKNIKTKRKNVNLFFYGEILESKIKSKIIDKANFAIIPSRSEVFPFVYSEYLNCGIIPICTDLDIFKNVTSLRNHIYEKNNKYCFTKTLIWANQLNVITYNSYLEKLRNDLYEFIDQNNSIEDLTNLLL